MDRNFAMMNLRGFSTKLYSKFTWCFRKIAHKIFVYYRKIKDVNLPEIFLLFNNYDYLINNIDSLLNTNNSAKIMLTFTI